MWASVVTASQLRLELHKFLDFYLPLLTWIQILPFLDLPYQHFMLTKYIQYRWYFCTFICRTIKNYSPNHFWKYSSIKFNILRSKPCFILRESLTVFLLAILNSKNCPSNIWNDSSGSINFILWNTSCLNMEYRIFLIIRLGLFSTQAIFGRAYFRVMLISEPCLFLKVTGKCVTFIEMVVKC